MRGKDGIDSSHLNACPPSIAADRRPADLGRVLHHSKRRRRTRRRLAAGTDRSSGAPRDRLARRSLAAASARAAAAVIVIVTTAAGSRFPARAAFARATSPRSTAPARRSAASVSDALHPHRRAAGLRAGRDTSCRSTSSTTTAASAFSRCGRRAATYEFAVRWSGFVVGARRRRRDLRRRARGHRRSLHRRREAGRPSSRSLRAGIGLMWRSRRRTERRADFLPAPCCWRGDAI